MRSIIVAAAAFLATAQLAAAEARWPAADVGYTFTMPAGCDTGRTPPEACVDQLARFGEARATAATAGKSLLVVFGATWCPSCKNLKSALPESLAGGLAAKVHVVEITISTLSNGKVTPVPSGDAVVAALKTARPEFNRRAFPFIALIDPATGHTSARNLDDLEQSGIWNRQSLTTAIELAHVAATSGKSAPAEPGWLRRKWLRLGGG